MSALFSRFTLVASVGVAVLLWQFGAALEPGRLVSFEIGAAFAQGEGGDGADGPSGAEPKTVRKVRLTTFRNLTRNELITLRETHSRDDTVVEIENFPRWATSSLLDVAIRDRRTIRRILRRLSRFSRDKERQKILKEEFQRLKTRIRLFDRDVAETKRQISQEEGRLRDNSVTRTVVPSARLKALQATLLDQQGRALSARVVLSFVETWFIHPGMGRP